tara:strand:+ start:731 stop:1033 length:303 start_codon:yes stop_codon:yes gene_type:complete
MIFSVYSEQQGQYQYFAGSNNLYTHRPGGQQVGFIDFHDFLPRVPDGVQAIGTGETPRGLISKSLYMPSVCKSQREGIGRDIAWVGTFFFLRYFILKYME